MQEKRPKYQGKRSTTNRAAVRATLPGPCTKCGGVVTEDMQWHADHIRSRAELEALGVPVSQIDSPANLGPAHKSCNERDGAAMGNRARAKARKAAHITPIRREISFSDGAQTVPGVPTQNPSPISGGAL